MDKIKCEVCGEPAEYIKARFLSCPDKKPYSCTEDHITLKDKNNEDKTEGKVAIEETVVKGENN